MCCKGFFKRAIPFFLTFLIGILIAGIFIPIGSSNFQFRKSGWQRHREQHERMEFEIRQLREENERLREQLDEDRTHLPAGDGEGYRIGCGDELKQLEVIRKVDKSIKNSER